MAVVCELVKRVEHFAQHSRYNYASKDGALVARFDKLVLNDQLLPHIGKRLQCEICFKLVCNGAHTRIQKLNHANNGRVGPLLSDLIDARFQAINLDNGSGVRRHAFRELVRDFGVNCQ